MVSFFGIKFGGEKKKGTQKDQITRPSQLDASGTDPSSDSQNHNFSRPGRPKSRPGTASSQRGSNVDWRAPYMMGAGAAQGANSSMVDLSAPRRGSVSSLRHPRSDLHLSRANKTWSGDGNGNGNGSFGGAPRGLAGGLPSPLAATSPARSATPERTKSMAGEGVLPPIDIHPPSHFRDSTIRGSRPGTPASASIMATKSPLGQFAFGLEEQSSIRRVEDDEPIMSEDAFRSASGLHGYPSPPPSIEAGPLERPLSSAHGDGRPKTAAGAVAAYRPPRGVDPTGSHSLPSPVASLVRSSEDSKWDAPVIRNVHAKRDTLTALSPRRQSFSMEANEREQQVNAAEVKPGERKMGSGGGSGNGGLLTGNIAAFDFGESVRRSAIPPAAMQRRGSSPSRSPESPGSWTTTSLLSQRSESPKLPRQRAESPLRTENPLPADSPPKPVAGFRKASMDDRKTAKERGMIEPMTNETINKVEEKGEEEDVDNDQKIDMEKVSTSESQASLSRIGHRTAASGGRSSTSSTQNIAWRAQTRTRTDSDAVASFHDIFPLDPPPPKFRPRTGSNASTSSMPTGGGSSITSKLDPSSSPPMTKRMMARKDSDTLVVPATPPEPPVTKVATNSSDERESRSRARETTSSPKARARAKSEAPAPRTSSIFHRHPFTPEVPSSPAVSNKLTKAPPRPIRAPPPLKLSSSSTPITNGALKSSAASLAPSISSPRSPYGPAVDKDAYTVTPRSAPLPPPNTRPATAIGNPSGPLSPSRSEFSYSPKSSSKGLPRGRRVAPPSELTIDPDARKSAMVAPLTPTRSMLQASSSSSGPSFGLAPPPRIPSPTFLSLEQSLGVDVDDWSKSFELSFDQVQGSLESELGLGLLNLGSPGGSEAGVTRVEASKAPPRSPLLSSGGFEDLQREKIALAEFGNGHAEKVAKEFEAGFI